MEDDFMKVLPGEWKLAAAETVTFMRIDPAIREQLDRIEAMLREVQQQIYDATGISDAARKHWERLERRDE